jgi:hypothetical protein
VTRLPVESWDVLPRLDLPSYELNTICPVTGDASGLEDHHVFRRSFTALGKEENDRLFWVEYAPPRDDLVGIAEDGGLITDGGHFERGVDPWEGEEYIVVKNRVALSPDAHLRITTNRARLEYRGTELWYIEGDEQKKLDLNLRLMEGSEKLSKPRRKPKATTAEERKARVNYSVRTPAGEEMVMPEQCEVLKDLLEPELSQLMDDPSKASPYWVWTTAASVIIQERAR